MGSIKKYNFFAYTPFVLPLRNGIRRNKNESPTLP